MSPNLPQSAPRIDVDEAQLRLEEIVEIAAAGQQFVITKNGIPIATMSALEDSDVPVGDGQSA